MREIEFRGKRVDNGEWVYGYVLKIAGSYYISNELTEIKGCFIPTNDKKGYQIEFTGLTEIIPETVGQYTGLKDKNGKKIFEGDIVYLHQTVNGYSQFIIAYLDYKFIPIYYNEKTKRPTRRFYEYDLDEFFEIGECEREIEVIGNIF